MKNEFILGAIESPTDLRDYDYSMVTGSSEEIEIPEKFELDYDIPVQNQGNVGSCVAHALMEMKSYIDNDMYSIGFIYGNRNNNDFQGSGLIAREALKHLVKEGDCFKESFDYNIEYPEIRNKMSEIGIDKLYAEASQFKSLAYIRLSADEIKEYLVKYKKPIMIVVRVYKNFYTAKTNKGIIPSKPVGAYKGNHAMVIVGYDKDKLIIVNSWGNTGDNGYYYLDINSSIIKELWALEDIKNVNRPKKNFGWEKVLPKHPSERLRWKYLKDNSQYAKDDWLQIKGKWYYFKNEYRLDNEWYYYTKDGKWYYFMKDSCEMATRYWCLWKNKYYYLGSDGAMLTDCITPDGYRVDKDGVWIK